MSSYVITGASEGIGVRRFFDLLVLECVRQLSAKSENKVFAIIRNKATATKLYELPGNNITILEADVTDWKALEVDYLINNAAGTTDPGLTLDQFPNPDAVEKYLLGNHSSQHQCLSSAAKNGSAKRVLTLSSGLRDLGFTLAGETPARAGYSIGKAALNMIRFVPQYAARYKAEGFVFLAISPGIVDTSATATSAPSAGTLAEGKMLFKAVARSRRTSKAPSLLKNRLGRSWNF
ncbi:hypothetical protein B0H14DRAFT_2589194 [Mycena olivaceomarginata]|nr:hypothetical protein B0H14DRAFT_2589194 [Mycena olivaceomarginata]